MQLKFVPYIALMVSSSKREPDAVKGVKEGDDAEVIEVPGSRGEQQREE